MLDLHEDIQSSLAKLPTNESDSDLEQELADLMKSENENTGNDGGMQGLEKLMDDLDLHLPDVPTNSPQRSQPADITM